MVGSICLTPVHTLQVDFLFSDWLFSEYAESIENVHCTPRTAPRLRDVLLVRDCARDCHIDRSIFFHWVKVLIFFMYTGILKPLIFIYDFSQAWANDFVFLSCMNWVNTCVSLIAREMIQMPVHLRWCWCSSNVSPTARVHWIWIISIAKRLTHLLTYNQWQREVWTYYDDSQYQIQQ